MSRQLSSAGVRRPERFAAGALARYSITEAPTSPGKAIAHAISSRRSLAAKCASQSALGARSPHSPATPPGMRVRTGRFRKVEPLRAGGSSRPSPQGLRRSTGFRFGFSVFRACKAQLRLIGWRHATREFDVLRLALTVWAFLTPVSTTPAADFCRTVRVNRSTLSPEFETCNRSPEVSSIAFHAQPPDLPPVSLMDKDFAIIGPLARNRRPPIRFLFIGSGVCYTLLSDLASRPGPCVSLTLLLHQDG